MLLVPRAQRHPPLALRAQLLLRTARGAALLVPLLRRLLVRVVAARAARQRRRRVLSKLAAAEGRRHLPAPRRLDRACVHVVRVRVRAVAAAAAQVAHGVAPARPLVRAQARVAPRLPFLRGARRPARVLERGVAAARPLDAVVAQPAALLRVRDAGLSLPLGARHPRGAARAPCLGCRVLRRDAARVCGVDLLAARPQPAHDVGLQRSRLLLARGGGRHPPPQRVPARCLLRLLVTPALLVSMHAPRRVSEPRGAPRVTPLRARPVHRTALWHHSLALLHTLAGIVVVVGVGVVVVVPHRRPTSGRQRSYG